MEMEARNMVRFEGKKVVAGRRMNAPDRGRPSTERTGRINMRERTNNPPLRVLICGSRTWDDPVPINWVVLGLAQECEAWDRRLLVISGGAAGADEAGKKAAYAYDNADHQEFPAMWSRDGKAAGPIRNQQMLDEGKPDVVVAFADDLASSKGTADMVRRARKAGVPTYVMTREV